MEERCTECENAERDRHGDVRWKRGDCAQQAARGAYAPEDAVVEHRIARYREEEWRIGTVYAFEGAGARPEAGGAGGDTRFGGAYGAGEAHAVLS